MTKIKSINDLRAERVRLKLQLAMAEEKLKDDVAWLKDELKPVKAAGKLFSSVMINKNNGVINDGVRFTIDAVLKNLILSKAGWITKLVVPYLVKNLSSNYILEKRPEIFSIIRNFIHKARKSTRDNYTQNQNQNHNHYDKSTVDEMDY
jgi:hypothetical protein